jgi:hypothetical protein
VSIDNNQNTKNIKAWNVKPAKIFEDDVPVARVDIKVEDYDRLIMQKGINLCVFRSMYCPNTKSTDGAEHEIDCPLCNGSGYIDVNPIKTRGFIQNQALEKMLDNQGGQFDGNSVSITFLSGIELQYFTLIELNDFTQIYYQRIKRKAGSNIDILKYRACRVNVIMDSNGVQYYQDNDFKIDPNGSILWSGARKPADHIIYSIHYECHVQFRAVRAMHVNRYTQYKPSGEALVSHVKLPEQWLATKEFLVRRHDINTNQDLQEGPFDNHTNTTGDNT